MLFCFCRHDFGADKLYEYKWPQSGKGDWYMLQEQISDYLGVKSFKRKYPGKGHVISNSIWNYIPLEIRDSGE